MLVLPRKRRLAIALFALALLALAVWAVPSLSQPVGAGYARLLRRHAAPPPTAVADCAVASLAMVGYVRLQRRVAGDKGVKG